MADTPAVPRLDDAAEQQRLRLVELRRQLRSERSAAVSPAIDRALELADIYIFLGLSCLGHTDELFPGES